MRKSAFAINAVFGIVVLFTGDQLSEANQMRHFSNLTFHSNCFNFLDMCALGLSSFLLLLALGAFPFAIVPFAILN